MTTKQHVNLARRIEHAKRNTPPLSRRGTAFRRENWVSCGVRSGFDTKIGRITRQEGVSGRI
jgi:hypothetical protein